MNVALAQDNVIPFPKRPSALVEPEYTVEREAEYSVTSLADEPAAVVASPAEVEGTVDTASVSRVARTRLVMTQRGVILATIAGTLVVGTVISKVSWFFYFLMHAS